MSVLACVKERERVIVRVRKEEREGRTDRRTERVFVYALFDYVQGSHPFEESSLKPTFLGMTPF